MDDFSDLLARASASTQEAVSSAEAALDTARTQANRVELAVRVVEAGLPAGSTVGVLGWPEEPNSDGTYDVDVTDARDLSGEFLVDLAGQSGAVAAGRVGGGTDWDVFAVRGDPRRVAVDRVLDWVQAQGWATS